MAMNYELNNILKSSKPATMFEIYVCGGPAMVTGWEIKNVVIPAHKEEAKEIIKTYPNFDCIITTNDWFHVDQAEVYNP